MPGSRGRWLALVIVGRLQLRLYFSFDLFPLLQRCRERHFDVPQISLWAGALAWQRAGHNWRVVKMDVARSPGGNSLRGTALHRGGAPCLVPIAQLGVRGRRRSYLQSVTRRVGCAHWSVSHWHPFPGVGEDKDSKYVPMNTVASLLHRCWMCEYGNEYTITKQRLLVRSLHTQISVFPHCLLVVGFQRHNPPIFNHIFTACLLFNYTHHSWGPLIP